MAKKKITTEETERALNHLARHLASGIAAGSHRPSTDSLRRLSALPLLFEESASITPKSGRVQFDSWLHYTAYQIHQQIGEKGHFWHQEPFDHLVRSVDQYVYLRDYIADNPRKAKLKEGEFLYRRYAR